MPPRPDQAREFQALHQLPGAFIIPNPWDVGSAKILVAAGYKALATTSAGLALAAGKEDHELSRDEVLEHCRALVAAVDVPVAADLGACFGDDPATVAETFRLAAETGLAGGSVEDMKPNGSLYPLSLAAERVRAAAEVARAQPVPFTLTARAENFLVGKPDLDDTIKRLQSFQEAGADVLYAPGLRTAEQIAAVVSSVDRPVNVIAGMKGFALTFTQLQELGVKRISLGSALAAVAASALIGAAREMRDQGTFTFGGTWQSLREINSTLHEQ